MNRSTADETSATAARVGRRVLICGLPGAGKSTLARKLAEATGLRIIEGDRLQFDARWRLRPPDDRLRDTLAALAECPDGWIHDGTFPLTHELVLDRCDTLVWLRPRFAVLWPRLVRRQAVSSWRNERSGDAPAVTWRRSFCHPNAAVWWTLRHRNAYHRWIAQSLAAAQRRPDAVVVSSDEDTAALVARAAAPQRSPAASTCSAASSPECTQSAMPTPR